MGNSSFLFLSSLPRRHLGGNDNTQLSSATYYQIQFSYIISLRLLTTLDDRHFDLFYGLGNQL